MNALVEGPPSQPLWSPDGKQILFDGRNDRGNWSQYLVSVSDAEVTEIFRDRSYQRFDPVWSRDGKKFFYFVAGTADEDGIYSIERDLGIVKKISDESNARKLALHPDGSILAVSTSDSKKLLSIEDGEVRELYKVSGSRRGALAWSPDGRWLYFRKWNDDKKVAEIWRVSVDGKEAGSVGIAFPQLQYITVHPDGKRIAFTVGDRNKLTSIWAMKNFLKED